MKETAQDQVFREGRRERISSTAMEQFARDWMKAEFWEAWRRARKQKLRGAAAEVYVFDRMTNAGYKLNLVTGEYYF